MLSRKKANAVMNHFDKLWEGLLVIEGIFAHVRALHPQPPPHPGDGNAGSVQILLMQGW